MQKFSAGIRTELGYDLLSKFWFGFGFGFGCPHRSKHVFVIAAVFCHGVTVSRCHGVTVQVFGFQVRVGLQIFPASVAAHD